MWSFEKTFRSKVMAWKSQYANELELTVSRSFGTNETQQLREGQLVGRMLLQRLATGATGVNKRDTGEGSADLHHPRIFLRKTWIQAPRDNPRIAQTNLVCRVPSLHASLLAVASRRHKPLFGLRKVSRRAAAYRSWLQELRTRVP